MKYVAPQLGDILLGSFQIRSELGSGGCATAYLADQLGTDRYAVVKVPHAHLLASRDGDEIRRRFEAEARAATRVIHPNLVTVYAVGLTPEGLPVIAMEFVEGEPLVQRLERSAPLPRAELGALGQQLGEALLALHAAGIVHRDLSPSNVIICDHADELSVKILDFGVAKRLDMPSQTLGPLGTPGYLAPEQLRGRVTPRSDVYSLGAILWWALTGHERPDDFHDGSLLAQINSMSGPNPLELRPEASRALAEVVSHALIPDEGSRPTCVEFLRQWRAALGSLRPEPSPRPSLPADHPPAEAKTTARGLAAPIALVIADPILHELVATTINTLDRVETVSCELREVTRANPGAYSVLVLDAGLPGLDLREVVMMLAQCYEDLRIVVLGRATDQLTNWAVLGADDFLVIPEQLAELRGTIARSLGRVATTTSTSATRLSESVVRRLRAEDPRELLHSLDHFIGRVPQWLAELHRALRCSDAGGASSSCQQLASAAESLGAHHLTQLARAALAFVAVDDLDNAASVVDAAEAEYHSVFGEVFLLIDHIRRSENML